MKAFVFIILAAIPGSLAHAEATKAYPEVVPVFSMVSFEGRSSNPGKCTGTFIHPRLLLTASHCVRHFNVERMGGQIIRATDMSGNAAPDLTAGPKDVFLLEKKWWGTKKITAAKIHVSDSAVPVSRADLSLSFVEQDLAIIEFATPQNRGATPRRIARQTPVLDQQILSIGFGHHGPTPSISPGLGGMLPTKHAGSNLISMLEFGLIMTDGDSGACERPENYGHSWAVCPGDSGGPLIDPRTGELLGVASSSLTMKRTGREISMFTDLTSGPAVEFVESVLRQVEP